MTKIQDTLINSKIKAGEDDLRYPMQLVERFNALQDFIRSADAAPTQQEYDVYKELIYRISPIMSRLNTVFTDQVAQFNQQVAKTQSFCC